jgi:recombination protein RecA
MLKKKDIKKKEADEVIEKEKKDDVDKVIKKEKNEGLEIAKKAIIKKYGAVISILKDHEDMNIQTISSGSISLDVALGRGGFGRGRIYEIFGPNSSGKTTLAINAIIEAQNRGLTCCFIDAEHAVDPVLFKNYGVNIDDLIIIQGFDGEGNLDALESLLRSGAIDVAVVDSVSSLIPRMEVERDVDQDTMAALARLMSKALRRLTPLANQTNTLLIFINQLRMKIGSYGCFHYDTLVNFVDGKSLPIGEIVDNKIKGKVWTFNEKTNEFETNSIIDWHDNGLVGVHKDFIHIQTDSINGRGRFGFTCTTDHKVLTEYGWKKASELSYDDRLISKYEETINGTYGDFLRGCLVGDSHISVRHKNTATLRLQDNENVEYIDWKLKKISQFINFTRREISRGYRYESDYTYELAKIKKSLGNRDPIYFLNNYSDLGFATWIMDDGNLDLNSGHRRYGLSIKRLKNNVEALDEIRNKFIKLGFGCNYRVDSGFFQFETSLTDTIANVICKYVPECMDYKLPSEYRGKYEDFVLHNKPKTTSDYVSIKEIRYASDRQMRKKHKFDISIEKNHNYMIGGKHNGVIVHNSPEITTGGEAMGFYATGRISVRGPESKKRRIIDNVTGETIGHESVFEVVKNKLAAPFRKASIKLIYGEGYDKHWEILELATSLGIVDRAGAWYKYNDESFAQGEDKAVVYFKENAEFYEKIRNKVIGAVGLKEFYEHPV